MGNYSHSKLSTFEQCKYRYKLRYIDKIKPEVEKSIEAHLGTCVHDTLEWLYKEVLDERVPTLDDAIVYYTEQWTKENTDNYIIVKKEFTSKDYYNKGIHFLIDYYVEHTPFNDGTLELEKKVMIKLGEHFIVGYIDRLSEDKETGEIGIHDYKTANSLPTQGKMDKDRQLALYSIAIKELMGQNKSVKLIWHYLAHKTRIISERTDEQLEKLKTDILELINFIENTTEFPTNETILCHWCEYKSMCPLFNKDVQENEHQKEIEKISETHPTLSKYFKD